jgi:tyrosyl-tRNA synthetase
MDLYSELEWRGLVYDATEGARALLAGEPVSGYVGFDPTAASLHVGNLQVIMPLVRMQRFGHLPIALVGGGTGLIGDPSGKTVERQLLTPSVVAENVRGIRGQLERFLDFDGRQGARLVDNAEWLTGLGAIEFMRDVGKHFSVNAMLAKESVKKRIDGTDGISYTEFSYSLLQAYDFLELHRRYGCTLQMGGSDQWGNITAGMELIRRVAGGKAHGLVLPLITTSSGAKFGKTEAGTIWLDPARTSAYEFYQFWLNADDRDAVRYLKFFTLLERPRIEEIAAAAAAAPEKRVAQRELAREVTRLVHGDESVTAAEQASAALFSRDPSAVTFDALLLVAAPSIEVAYAPEGWRVQTLLTQAGLARSMSEAARLIKARGVYVNGKVFVDEKGTIPASAAIEGKGFMLAKGKRDKCLVRIVEEPQLTARETRS